MGGKSKQMRVRLITEGDLEAIAAIVGGNSAAALALRDIAARRERGEDPVAVQHEHSILVVPRADLVAA